MYEDEDEATCLKAEHIDLRPDIFCARTNESTLKPSYVLDPSG
jgi:hypothetical protein